MRYLLAAISVLLTLWLPIEPAAPVAQGQCLSRQEQRQAVRSGRVVRPGRLGRRLGGKVLRVTLCRGGGDLVWLITVLRNDGRVLDYVIDARSGRQLR